MQKAYVVRRFASLSPIVPTSNTTKESTFWLLPKYWTGRP